MSAVLPVVARASEQRVFVINAVPKVDSIIAIGSKRTELDERLA